MNQKRHIIFDSVKLGSYEQVDNLPLSAVTHNSTDTGVLSGLIIRGYETKFGGAANENGEVYDKSCLDDFFERYYIKNKLNMPLDIQHRNDLLHLCGRVLVVEVNSVGFYFVCYIPKTYPEYNRVKVLIEEGVLQGLSKCGWSEEYEYIYNKDGSFSHYLIKKMDILSMSLVTTPANGIPFEKVQEIRNALTFRKVEEPNRKKSIYNHKKQ